MNAVVLLRAVFDASATGGVYAGPYVLDAPSESAVALARNWRTTAREGRVIGIAVGPPEWEPALRSAMMLGCDEVTRLWSESTAQADALTVAAVLASRVPADSSLVIGGDSSSDHGAGVVAAAVAENLGWDYLHDVTAVASEGAALTMCVRLDGGKRRYLKTVGPVVVAAARMPTPAFYPRVARCIAARKASIPVSAAGEGDAALPSIEVTSYGPARPLTRHLLQPSAGANPAQRLRQLMAGGVANRGAKTVGGAGEDAGRKLADLLVSEGFVP